MSLFSTLFIYALALIATAMAFSRRDGSMRRGFNRAIEQFEYLLDVDSGDRKITPLNTSHNKHLV